MKKRMLALAVALAVGATGAEAVQISIGSPVTTSGNNFTAITRTGVVFAGTNDVVASWDGTVFTDQADYIGPGSISNLTLSSDEAFFMIDNWVAHDVQVFGPGSYSFDTSLGGEPSDRETQILNMVVGPGQLGAHLLFDWNGNLNLDIAIVWDLQKSFGPSLLFTGGDTGAAGDSSSGIDYIGIDNVTNAPWDLSATDGNGDGISGIPMVIGDVFQESSFVFNINGPKLSAVPVPASLWLFLSGLVGLGVRFRGRGK